MILLVPSGKKDGFWMILLVPSGKKERRMDFCCLTVEFSNHSDEIKTSPQKSEISRLSSSPLERRSSWAKT